MFVIKQGGEYRWPVSFNIPKDGGGFAKQTFTAIFKRMTQSKVEQLVQAEGMTDRALAREVLAGWGDDLTDEDGNPVPFNPGNVESILDEIGVATAIVAAYMESISGAKRKN